LRSVSIAGVLPNAIANNLQVLKDELNVKEVKLLDTAAHLVQKEVRINARKAGKRLTSEFKEVMARVKDGDYEIGSDGSLRVGAGLLLPDEFEFRYVSRADNSGVAVHETIVVSLDQTVDLELVLEGYARDLNREIQDMRKRARLSYSDRIIISISRSSTMDAILERHKQWLAEQTLARAIVTDGVPQGTTSAEVEIGDDRIAVAIALATE
jgi:isoleucyl-tRNA synthetase